MSCYVTHIIMHCWKCFHSSKTLSLRGRTLHSTPAFRGILKLKLWLMGSSAGVLVPAGVFAGNDLDTFSLLERSLDPRSLRLKRNRMWRSGQHRNIRSLNTAASLSSQSQPLNNEKNICLLNKKKLSTAAIHYQCHFIFTHLSSFIVEETQQGCQLQRPLWLNYKRSLEQKHEGKAYVDIQRRKWKSHLIEA